jgi:hypothetical protein
MVESRESKNRRVCGYGGEKGTTPTAHRVSPGNFKTDANNRPIFATAPECFAAGSYILDKFRGYRAQKGQTLSSRCRSHYTASDDSKKTY